MAELRLENKKNKRTPSTADVFETAASLTAQLHDRIIEAHTVEGADAESIDHFKKNVDKVTLNY